MRRVCTHSLTLIYKPLMSTHEGIGNRAEDFPYTPKLEKKMNTGTCNNTDVYQKHYAK